MLLQPIRDSGSRSCLQTLARVLRTIKYCKGLVQSKTEEKKDEKKEAISGSSRVLFSAITFHSLAGTGTA